MIDLLGTAAAWTWSLLTAPGIAAFVAEAPLRALLIFTAFAAFALDVVLGLPAAVGLAVKALARRDQARRVANRLRAEREGRSGAFTVALTPFRRDPRGDLSSLVTSAARDHAPAFLFGRAVEVAPAAVGLPEGPDGTPGARAFAASAEIDLVVWAAGPKGRGLDKVYFVRGRGGGVEDAPAHEIRLMMAQTPAEREALARGIGYLLARAATPVAAEADNYRPEKLLPVLDALDALAAEPPAGLGTDFERVLREDAARIAYSIGARQGLADPLRRASRLRLRILAEISKDSRPVDWALARADVGRTQLALGEVESDPRRVAAATEAFAEAAEILFERAQPVARARALVDLGAAHLVAAELEPPDAPTHHNAAVEAYRSALAQPEHLPARLAVTAQRGLGRALDGMAAWSREPAAYVAAAEAWRAASSYRARTLDPAGWADSQHRLGLALATLAMFEENPRGFVQAAEAFRAALGERPREADPLLWAESQLQLGHALYGVGKNEAGVEALEGAVAAWENALGEADKTSDPYAWAQMQTNLANARQAIGERTGRRDALEQAVAGYRAALSVLDREQTPFEWAGTQNNLGNALHNLGERASGADALEQALQAHAAALTVRTKERHRDEWAATRNNMGLVLTTLAQRKRDPKRLEDAIRAYRDALGVFRLSGNVRHAVLVERNLDRAQAMLDGARTS